MKKAIVVILFILLASVSILAMHFYKESKQLKENINNGLNTWKYGEDQTLYQYKDYFWFDTSDTECFNFKGESIPCKTVTK